MFVTISRPCEQLVSGILQQHIFVVCLRVLSVLNLVTVGRVEKHQSTVSLQSIFLFF